jgi:hypothetical protein
MEAIPAAAPSVLPPKQVECSRQKKPRGQQQGVRRGASSLGSPRTDLRERVGIKGRYPDALVS